MKRVALSVVLLLVWLAPRLESTAVRCTSTNPCKQPPCEFFYELKVAKAMVRVLSMPAPRGGEDLRAMNAAIRKQLRKYTKCPANYFYQPPPNFWVGSSSSCDIGYPGGAKSLEDVLAATNSCAEPVRAKFAQAEQERLFCLSNKDLKGPLPIGEFKLQQKMAYQAAVESMEVALGRFLASCAPSATTSRRVAEAGLQALKKAAYKERMAWAERLVKEVAQ